MIDARPSAGRRWRRLARAVTACAFAATLATAVQAAPALAADEDLAQYVDPFIGTDDSNATSAPPGGKMGNAFPGATAPFGRVQWSPDNNELDGASYKYTSPEGVGPIDGFSVTHTSGAGCMSLRDLATYATVGAGQAASKLSFLHSDEVASPGYYKVKLSNQVVVELTATQRTGFGKFTFPSTQYANIVVDAKKRSSSRWVSVDAANRKISGWVESGYFCGRDHSYRLYFTVVYDRPFTVTSNDDGKVMLTFDARTNLVVQSKVGTSLVSEANAAANLTSENNGWDFSAVQAGTRAAWNARLNSVKISGASPDQREIFYTALYQSMLHPNVATDSNGQYRGLDGAVHTATGYTQYVNFSGWDVYRSQVQLLAIIAPTVASDWARSLLTHAAQCGGAMPKWTLYNSESSVMIGTPAIPAIASIAAFGANGFDTQEALDRMVYAADTANATCKKANVAEGLAGYLSRGYASTDDPIFNFGGNGSASYTQEYAIADFALAQFAKDQRGDTATYDKYLARSKNWRNVFDPASKFIQPRRSDGTFTSSSNLTGMVEGNSAQYTWMVPHDINTVVDFIGGPATAVSRLDSLFTKLNSGTQEPYFYIGNEPSFTTPWAYLWAGAPWRTQDVVERIRSESFTSAPGGYPGNIDLGATSAWYVLAALGMYPAVPGTDLLTFNGPSFPSATVALANGKTLTINAPGASSTNRYVQGLQVNGSASTKAWTRFSALKDGATLTFTMGGSPSTWGSAAADGPPLFVPTPPKAADDLARNVPVTSASQTCAAGEEPAKAVDGSATTKWCAFTTGRQGWLMLDLGQARTVARWVVAHAGAGGESSSFNTRDFRLQSATTPDGPWVDSDTVAGNTASTTDRTIVPVTARWWRVLITDPTQVSTNSAIRVYGVNLYAGTGTPTSGDLAQGKPAASNNSCAANEDAAKAVDGSATTKWCGFVSNGEAWLRVDLGAATSVRRWVVRHAQSGGEQAGYNTRDFALEYSSSASGPWTRFDGVTGNTASSTDRTASAVSARYWRLRITSPTQTTDGAARIYALELYN